MVIFEEEEDAIIANEKVFCERYTLFNIHISKQGYLNLFSP